MHARLSRRPIQKIKRRGRRKPYRPTPERIHQECREIQRTWTAFVRQGRESASVNLPSQIQLVGWDDTPAIIRLQTLIDNKLQRF